LDGPKQNRSLIKGWTSKESSKMGLPKEPPNGSVTDLDPSVFGPPGSGSVTIWTDPDRSITKQKKIKINLDFHCFVTF
jgi:hypothetical protein